MSPVGDVEDMAKNAFIILRNDETLMQFKANAMSRAREFDINVVMPLYERYYNKVINEIKVEA